MNIHVSAAIYSTLYEDDMDNNMMDTHELTMELDTHATMVLIGRNFQVISRSGQTVQVNPFTPDYKALPEVPNVDTVIAYECHFIDKVYIILYQNALYVLKMENNLIPPFILKEAGIEVNNVLKIQVDNPTEMDHSIYFQNGHIQIPLNLDGIFLYFPTRRPSDVKLQDMDDILILTPDGSCDPHNNVYIEKKGSMVDWKRNIIEGKTEQNCVKRH